MHLNQLFFNYMLLLWSEIIELYFSFLSKLILFEGSLTDFNILQMPETLLQNVLKCLTSVVNSETTALASLAMQALGHIGLRVALPPLVENSGSGRLFEVVLEHYCFMILYLF